MPHPSDQLSAASRHLASKKFQFVANLLVLVMFFANGVPGRNESHYLTKAKAVWDSSFCSGGDLFLQSSDSHFLATAFSGTLAWFFPLAAVAWIGRAISWTLMAWAWTRISTCLRLPQWAGPFALTSLLVAIQNGHWAGEWMVGGFEAKSIAYPLAILGLAEILDGNWKRWWIWIGLAIAWHPVAAGWIGLSAGILWLSKSERIARMRREFAFMLLGAAIALVGLLPAAAGMGGSDRDGIILAPAVHVFLRLQHHMRPLTFAPERHWAASYSFGLLVIATLVYFKSNRQPKEADCLKPILSLAWLSVMFSGIGLAIDYFVSPMRPDLAAKLLRFYWFRWSDVAVPLAYAAVFWKFATKAIANRTVPGNSGFSSRNPVQSATVLVLIIATLTGLGFRIRENWLQDVPEADQLVASSSGRYALNAEAVANQRYIEWLAVCQWIRENTPADSLWFTPKYQQTFKWHAQRAEVICWKDVPQDNASVIEWYKRIQACEPPRDSNSVVREWKTEELLQLSRKYGFRWVLLDRSYQQTPPALEIIYPINIENRSFAICRIPDGLLD